MKKLIFICLLILMIGLCTFIPALCIALEDSKSNLPVVFILTGCLMMIGATKILIFKAGQ